MNLKKLFKDNIIAVVLSIGVVGWTFVKDLISTGADVKFNERVFVVIQSDVSRKYIEGLIYKAIDNEMNDPFALMEILSSQHVSEYAEEKAQEVREAVKNEIMRNDSAKGDLIHDLGIGTGMRNEDIMPELIKLLKAFRRGDLNGSRNVRANF